MTKQRKTCMVWMMITLGLLLSAGAGFGEQLAEGSAEILVRGSDDFVVLREEMDSLQELLSQVFRTTESEYCRAVMRMKLFTREARAQGLDQIPEQAAEQKSEMQVIHELSNLYVKQLLDAYKLHPHAVESYYLSHTQEFLDQAGELMLLDDNLRTVIRDRLMKLKRAEVVNQELERLMQKYDVEIINPVCHKKEE